MDSGTIGITKMIYLSEAKKRLEELQTIYPASVTPCREDEVLALERRVGRSLPGAYKERNSFSGWDMAQQECFEGRIASITICQSLAQGPSSCCKKMLFPSPYQPMRLSFSCTRAISLP